MDEIELKNSFLSHIRSYFETDDSIFNDVASQFYIAISEEEEEEVNPIFALKAFKEIAIEFLHGKIDPLNLEESIYPTLEIHACSKSEEYTILKYVVKYLKKKSKNLELPVSNNLIVAGNFIKQLLKQRQSSQNLNSSKEVKNVKASPEDGVKKIMLRVEQAIENIDPNEKWKYAFRSIEDYKYFVYRLTYYFSGIPFVQSQLISLKRGSKTRLAKAMNPLQKDLSKQTLRSDKGFLNLLKDLDQFASMSEDEIYSAIIK